MIKVIIVLMFMAFSNGYAQDRALDRIFSKNSYNFSIVDRVVTYSSKSDTGYSNIVVNTKIKYRKEEINNKIDTFVRLAANAVAATSGKQPQLVAIENETEYIKYVISEINDKTRLFVANFAFSLNHEVWTGQFVGSLDDWEKFLKLLKSEQTQTIKTPLTP